MDLFEKRKQNFGELGRYADEAEGYYMFPRLEGEIGPRMVFNGKERLVWSLNNYLGLANHPEVRQADAEGAKQFGLAAPMGARMMSGQTKYHEQLERELAEFVGKESAYLANFGYPAMVSIIDALLDRRDILIYDSEAHACIIDGKRLHIGQSFSYPHNDIEKLEKQLQRATKLIEEGGNLGAILVVTEGVYGMTGSLGNLPAIAALKKKYKFRLMIDDAHGFGTMGTNGRGTHEHFNVMDDIDLYFGTFAKSMAGIGGFVAGEKGIIRYLQYNLRSQIYAKSLPMPMVIGSLKRLDLIRKHPEYREKLWTIVHALQNGLKERGFNIGITQSPVTPVVLNGDTAEATHLAYDLRETYDIFCSTVIYPVIPKGMIIFRLIPTAVHSLEDVQYTLETFSTVKEKLDAGGYRSANLKAVKI